MIKSTWLCVVLFVFGLFGSLVFAGGNEVSPGMSASKTQSTSQFALPLSSIGSALGWTGNDRYRFVVTKPGVARLELRSPVLNPRDYLNNRRPRNHFGDERYNKAAFSTVFGLFNSNGQKITAKRYGVSPDHSRQTFFEGELAPGLYPFEIASSGAGKNTFSAFVSPNARLEASRFTLNLRSRFRGSITAARIPVTKDLVGKYLRIRNYDADGPNEMRIALKLPDGNRRALSISGNLRWSEDRILVTPKMVGTWTLLVRSGKRPKQFSNALRFDLSIYPTGIPLDITVSTPVYAIVSGPKPSTTTPTPTPPSAQAKPETKPASAQTQKAIVARAEDRQGKTIPGASITTKVLSDGARRTTLVVPNGWRVVTTKVTGSGRLESPTSVRFGPSGGSVTFVLERISQLGDLQFFKTVSPTQAKPGETVVYTLEVVNPTQGNVLGLRLQDPLPDGLRGVPFDARFEIPAKQRRVFTVQAVVVANAPELVRNQATLSDNKTQLKASADLRVLRPVPPQAQTPPPAPPTAPPAPPPATGKAIAFSKTNDQTSSVPGSITVYRLALDNPNNEAALVSLRDTLPKGLSLVEATCPEQVGVRCEIQSNNNTTNATVALAGNTNTVVRLTTRVDPEARGSLTNQASAETNGQTLTASDNDALTPVLDLALEGQAEPSNLEVGERSRLEWRISNTGPSSALETTFKPVLPNNLRLVAVATSNGTCDTLGVCRLGTLAPNASTVVLLTVEASAVGASSVSASVGSSDAETQLQNNQASIGLNINDPSTKLVLERASVNPSPALPGEEVQVALTVRNPGRVASNYSLSDNPGFLLEALQNPLFEGTLEAGASRTHTYTARVRQGEAAKGELSATLSVPGSQPQLGNTVFERTSLGLRKTVNSATVALGGRVTFTITATNPVARALTFDFTGNTQNLRLEQSENLRLDFAPTETKTITITARPVAVGAASNTINASLNGVFLGQSTAPLTVREREAVLRESDISVDVRLQNPPERGQILVADRLPDGAFYVPGSSRLVGQTQGQESQNQATLADPVLSDGWLIWTLPNIPAANTPSTLTYTVRHSEPIPDVVQPSAVLLRFNNELRVLEGDVAALSAVQQAQNTKPLPPPRQRVGAIIVNPANATHLRERDQTSITVDVPLQAENIVLRVNGNPVPENQIGNRIFDEGTGRLTLEYVGVQLRVGSNTLELATSAGGQDLRDTITVTVAGPVASIRITPKNTISNDGARPPEIKLELLDEYGRPTRDTFITVETTPDPSTPDENPVEPGHQIRTQDGVATLRLVGVGERRNVRVSANVGDVTARQEFAVTANVRPPLLNGIASLQLGFANSNNRWDFTVGASLQAFWRTPIFEDAQFTAAINLGLTRQQNTWAWTGDLLPDADTYGRFPVLGDESKRFEDALSSDNFYARLERGSSYLRYGRYSANITGLLSNHSALYNGLDALWVGENWQLYGFASFVPQTTRSNITPAKPYGAAGDGTSFYKIPVTANEQVRNNSEKLRIVERDKNNPGLIVSERELARLGDYTIDYSTATVFFGRPLATTSSNGNPLYLVVDYAVESDNNASDWRAGAQARLRGEIWHASLTALRFSTSAPLFAAGVGLDFGNASAELEVAHAGAPAASLEARYRTPTLEASLRGQYVATGYQGPSPTQAGFDLAANANWSILPGLKLAARYNLETRNLLVTSRENYRLEASYDFALLDGQFGVFTAYQSFFETQNNASIRADVYGVLGVRGNYDPVAVSVEQRLPISNGSSPQTVFGVSVAVLRGLNVELTDTITYGPGGGNAFALGVRGRFGNTNINAGYEQSGVAGDAGRARIGVDTDIPVTETTSVQAGAETNWPFNASPSGSLSLGLRYQDASSQANVRAQWSLMPQGFKQVYTAGAFFTIVPSPGSALVISPALEYVNGPEGEGGRFGIAAALRAERWVVLSNNQWRGGILSDQKPDEYKGETQASYKSDANLEIRFGFAYRLRQQIFTGQLNAGITVFVTDILGLGAQGAYQFQNTNTSNYSLGLEASLRVLPGFVLTGGVNLVGFDSIGTTQTAPGFYVRFDFVFDERSFGPEDATPAPQPNPQTIDPQNPNGPQPQTPGAPR